VGGSKVVENTDERPHHVVIGAAEGRRKDTLAYG